MFERIMFTGLAYLQLAGGLVIALLMLLVVFACVMAIGVRTLFSSIVGALR